MLKVLSYNFRRNSQQFSGSIDTALSLVVFESILSYSCDYSGPVLAFGKDCRVLKFQVIVQDNHCEVSKVRVVV